MDLAAITVLDAMAAMVVAVKVVVQVVWENVVVLLVVVLTLVVVEAVSLHQQVVVDQLFHMNNYS